ncbi:MAG TPA: CheR family methyltransferase [Solirubrobacteraceae bacterium]|jgi:two-component system CheB/CheR fusion protein|nr:CheR family methyltransferase [Solirubrobacteraceae bacterium]
MADGRGTLDQLLEFVKETRGFDFTGYKRSSIERRVAKRMTEVGVASYDEYVDYLELHGDEFVELFNTLLINVTNFFRDPPTWEHLATEIVPQLIATRDPAAPLRIWCAGCASGEEAYTVAMVFARVLGDGTFRDRVKIYATDVDEEALDEARHATYLPRQVEDVPRDALERFFERGDQRYVFRKDLRRSVIFGRNDLIQDAPISRIDLLVCRNTLMYFTAETQAQILRRFHFALDDDGILVLGKSEMLITHTDLFTPADLKWRVFRKVMKPSLRDRVRVLAADPGNGASQSVPESLREAAFDVAVTAHIVLDAHRGLVIANAAARRLFGVRVGDLGRPVQDLELSYRPLELRGPLDQLARELRGINIQGVPWPTPDRERVFDVHLAPLRSDGGLLGTSILYEDVSDVSSLKAEVTASKHELEQAYEELQSTVEELETTNEELQSTNEELETTNEELQSTNEELETMNEELQSANEELETMNDELRHRTLELNEINTFLESILATIGLAVAVLDRRQYVQIWNGQAREMWGVSADEAADQHLFALEIGLPVDQLKGPLRVCLSGESQREELVLDAINRRGSAFRCRVVAMPVGTGADGDRKVSGVILLMEPVGERAAAPVG